MKKLILIAAVMCTINAVSQAQEPTTVQAATPQDLVLEPAELSGGMPLMELLKERRSERNFSDQEVEPMALSRILWAANGVNRPEEGKRTAPSARNAQEIEIYILNSSGAYKYMPADMQVKKVRGGDARKQIFKDKFSNAPVILLLVANYDKMKDFETVDRDFYSAIDCGYVSQNIYLACASEQYATVAVGQVDRTAAAKMLNIKNGKVMIAHPIGRP